MPEPDDKSNETKSIVVKVGEEDKTFTAEDVSNLLAQQASATQKSQEVAGITQAAERYGVSVDELLENAEGSFTLMNTLIDKGIIDEQGNIVEKKGKEPEVDPKPKPQVPGTTPTSEEKIMEAVLKAQNPLMQEVEKLRNDNVLLMKLRLQDKAQDAFDNLAEEDVARVFTIAENDRNKSFMQHAEAYSKAKAEKRAELEQEFAKEHGIDLEEVKAKKLFEQDPAGGAAAIFKGRKLSFKRGEKDTVSPLQATQEYFEKL